MGEADNIGNEDFSILDLCGGERDPETVAPFFQDLNLFMILDKLSLRWGKNVRKYYRYLPGSAKESAYRRAVYADVKKDRIYNALMAFTKACEEVKTLRDEKEKVSNPMQKAVWQIREACAYCNAYEQLYQELSDSSVSSEGMIRFLNILKDILKSDEYTVKKKLNTKLLEQIKEIRFTITYDRDRMIIAYGDIPGDGGYVKMLREEGGCNESTLKNPFRADPYLTELENAAIEILSKKNTAFFRELRTASENAKGYESEVLQRFEQEILFYLSFCSLQRDMENEGFAFSTPRCTDSRRIEAKGLYDLAMALAFLPANKAVVPNDLYLDEDESFFVLTGPNQGGKTTFARSLGQLVYFSIMGLDVPALSASLPFFPDIQTHFSVEESIETGRGKLKEELCRLAPMMEENKKGSFVVINELFTTAASYDAQIMGKKVLKHFIALSCRGIYVTHLQGLADDQESVVSLRAMLDDNNIQTFKIQRGNDEGLACAENVVRKYRLSYEQLKERL